MEPFGGVGESGGRREPRRLARQREKRSRSLFAQGRSVLRSASPEAMNNSPCRNGRNSPTIPRTSKAHPAESRTRRQTSFRVLGLSFEGSAVGNPAVILGGEDRNRG